MRHSALAAAFAAATLTATLTMAGAAEKSDSDLEIVRGPYLVADAKTGQIVEEFDAQRPWFPASTTKLMTIYATFQAVRAGEIALDDQIKYSAYAAQQPASKMGFRPGSTLTLDNALKMMMVKSANDIAVAVAEAIGGSVEGFARRMNAAAEELGMERSHFVNPNGLPDERQVTSARDMALLARALLHDFPERRPYYAIPAIQIGGKILRNYNKLLTRFPGATGMKTGFICASGYNLVASAERDGRELVAVVFGEYGGTLRNEHAAALLDAAFEIPLRRVETETTLYNSESGMSYDKPFDMRPHVCGPKRAASVAELKRQDDRSDASHLTARINLGPPIKVSAIIPADYGEPDFVARLPRPRPGEGTGAEDGPPEVLPAFAPIDEGASASAPAEAIGAAAGEPHRLEEVEPE